MDSTGTTYVKTNAVDPTETATKRQAFIRNFNSRWSDVRGRYREWIEDGPLPSDKARFLRSSRSTFTALATNKVLEPLGEHEIERGNHWTASYIRTAYQKGLELAERDLHAYAGINDSITEADIHHATDFYRPFHREAIRAEYLKVYYKLEDHVGLAQSEVSSAAKEAVENDHSKRWLADETTARVRSKVQNYEKAMANTAVVRCVNEALLTAFEHAGVESVIAAVEREASITTNAFDDPHALQRPSMLSITVKTNAAGELQWATAGDDRVCEVCQALEGRVLKISDIRDNDHLQPPIHPNCRCRLVPMPMELVKDDEIIEVPQAFLEATGLSDMQAEV